MQMTLPPPPPCGPIVNYHKDNLESHHQCVTCVIFEAIALE